jgi:Ligand-gated ion channel
MKQEKITTLFKLNFEGARDSEFVSVRFDGDLPKSARNLPQQALPIFYVSSQQDSGSLYQLKSLQQTEKDTMGLAQWKIQSILAMLMLLMLPGSARAGQMAAFTEPQMTAGVNHRQNVCARHAAYSNGSVPLKDALAGMQLNVLVASGEYFFYDEKTGIDEDTTGIVEVLLDELAFRGGFTWRDSFGVQQGPDDGNWTGLLFWGAETYDITCDWWDANIDRLQRGIKFLTPWYDSSLILITKTVPEVISDDINLSNWLLPYETSVWLMTIFTVILSGLVYQWIEWLQNERGDRSLWEWWLENWYLSAMNFTQAYEYQPTSLASRTFGVSMAIWALVMTATYTANLASLLVERKPASIVIETLEQASVYGMPICVYEGTNTDLHIKKNYPSAKRILKQSEDGLYEALNAGDCKFVATSLTSYEKYKKMRKFNPSCDLEWVGEPLYKFLEGKASFAMKGDSGELCSGLIGQVIDYHMQTIIEEGVLQDMWDRENARTQSIDCDLVDPSSFYTATDEPTEIPTEAPGSRARTLHRDLIAVTAKQKNESPQKDRILLKAGGGAVGGAMTVKESESDGQQLTMEQMIGIFVFHWGFMAVSIAITYWNIFYNKHLKRPVGKAVSGVGRAMGSTLCCRVNDGSSSYDTHIDVKEVPANGEHDLSKTSNDNTKPTKNITRYSSVTNETDSGDSETMESSKEATPGKSMTHALSEMRMFQLTILEEQQAMQQQLRDLTAALVGSSSAANAPEEFARERSVTSHHQPATGAWKTLDV